MKPDYRLGAFRYIDSRLLSPIIHSFVGRPFNANDQCRVVIYGHKDPICRSQIEPFFQYSKTFGVRHGAAFRYHTIHDLLSGNFTDADIVLVQPWFTVGGDAIGTALEKLRNRLPNARIVFLDSYAHNDLRLARFVDPFIDLYYKKSIFRDKSAYFLPRRGDTNLTEYYSNLCRIDVGPPIDWQVPQSILFKLRLSPNFFTSSKFIEDFQFRAMPTRNARSIDLQSRLGGNGTQWYTAMRGLAQLRVDEIDGLQKSPSHRLSSNEFISELENSKLCFSPFGYGELCWRDIEAIRSGAVLIKPEMSHLETLPNLYEPLATYLPVRWDFADLEDVVRNALHDEAGMERIAREAWKRTAAYVRDEKFVDDMSEIFNSQTGLSCGSAEHPI